MNEAKIFSQQVGDFIERLQAGRDEDVSADLRWLGIARTELPKGFMSLVRSVAQLTSF